MKCYQPNASLSACNQITVRDTPFIMFTDHLRERKMMALQGRGMHGAALASPVALWTALNVRLEGATLSGSGKPRDGST